MDKFSKEKIVNNLTEITKNAHLGHLNDKDLDIKISVSQKRIKLPPNVMIFQAFAYLAATKLKPTTNRILMFLFSCSGYENYIGMDVITIAEELNITKRSVISGLQELENNKILIKYSNVTDKRRNDYFINPLSAWKGNSFTRKQTIKKIQQDYPAQLNLFPDENIENKKFI
jgi:hypothetical protein